MPLVQHGIFVKRLPTEFSSKIKFLIFSLSSDGEQLANLRHYGSALDVRNKNLSGIASLFAEREYFDDEREAKAIRKARRENT
jgi:hypothetical protein